MDNENFPQNFPEEQPQQPQSQSQPQPDMQPQEIQSEAQSQVPQSEMQSQMSQAEVDSQSFQSEPQSLMPQSDLQSQAPKAKINYKIIGAIIGVLVVIGIGIAVVMLLNNNKNTEPVEQSQSATDSTQEEQEEDSSADMIQRDTQRRNDISLLLSLIGQYQANNRGKIPEGATYLAGEDAFNCDVSKPLCELMKNYINPDATDNTFKDPSGEFYNIYLTADWSKTEDIMVSDYENENSKLVVSETDNSYTIGGDSPESEHIIYMIVGGRCNGEENGVTKSTSRKVGVLYALESGEIFCANN